jgi:hypothetical protein
VVASEARRGPPGRPRRRRRPRGAAGRWCGGGCGSAAAARRGRPSRPPPGTDRGSAAARPARSSSAQGRRAPRHVGQAAGRPPLGRSGEPRNQLPSLRLPAFALSRCRLQPGHPQRAERGDLHSRRPREPRPGRRAPGPSPSVSALGTRGGVVRGEIPPRRQPGARPGLPE